MRNATQRRSLIAVAVFAIATTACRDEIPTSPATNGQEPDGAILLNVIGSPPPTTMGWLAPLGKATAATPQNTELRPVVTVCRWVNSACTGSPVAQFSVGGGLTASTASFSATWNLSAANLPLTRARFRIAVTLNGTVVGLPILVDAMRGRWALSVPGQTPTLVAAASVPLQFRIGTPAEPPPPVATVTSGLGSAQTQFLPGTSATDTPRSTEQTTSLTTLSSTLASLQTALTGPRETALLALSQAASAADFAFQVAQPGDKADLDVIRLELAQAGKLLGVSN